MTSAEERIIMGVLTGLVSMFWAGKGCLRLLFKFGTPVLQIVP
ncbi:hypothetical protein [Bacillus sp. M6-12]|nr:hypothetical protein [Bacillus sp. M6-12]